MRALPLDAAVVAGRASVSCPCTPTCGFDAFRKSAHGPKLPRDEGLKTTSKCTDAYLGERGQMQRRTRSRHGWTRLTLAILLGLAVLVGGAVVAYAKGGTAKP